jgi:hypothetical protein
VSDFVGLSILPVTARDLADVGRLRTMRLLRLMLDDAIETKLPPVRCPALVLRGGRDRGYPAVPGHGRPRGTAGGGPPPGQRLRLGNSTPQVKNGLTNW